MTRLPRLILASASPRRRELLAAAGFEFAVRPASIREEPRDGETPAAYVRRLAREKAESVEPEPGEVVLAADTIVVVGRSILEKPGGPAEAAEMLKTLSGREHTVVTGICLRSAAGEVVDEARTRVRFRRLTQQEIDEYVASGEPTDKAGGYAIQGLASKFVERIHGCYFNVVGLPVSLVYGHLLEFDRIRS
jgi:septum formation protein